MFLPLGLLLWRHQGLVTLVISSFFGNGNFATVQDGGTTILSTNNNATA